MRKSFFSIIVVMALTLACLNVHAFNSLSVIKGVWMGEMQIPNGPKLTVGLEIFKKANGKWGGNVTSMDQGNRYITVSDISLNKQILNVKLQGGPIKIVGKVDLDLKLIDAEFKQGEHSFPLRLLSVIEIDDIKRKQTPIDNSKYTVKEVSYQNTFDSTWLSGTLTLPKGNNKRPAVMLIAGSGPSHRDAYHSGHRPFMLIADYLTRKGYIVLRSDKRGVYKSSGIFNEGDVENFAKDTQAAVKFLKKHDRVISNQIYLIGHSEGSMVAAMTSLIEKVAGIISMAGPGMSTLDILMLQDQTEPRAKGASEDDIQVLLEFSKNFYQVVLNETDTVTRKTKLQSLYDNLTGLELEIHNKWNERIGTLNVNTASSDSFKKFLKQDPLQSWKQVMSPVLIINGGKDSQVPAKENVEGIIKSLKISQKNVSHKIFPNLNHMFQNAKTGSTDEYAEIEETIDFEVLEDMVKWLDKQI